jgi:hypothetical protein
MAENPAEGDYAMLDEVEQEAIQGYDYEKARFLFNAQRTLRSSRAKDATLHYERELENYTQQFTAVLARKKAANELQYEEELAKEKGRLENQINELTAAQEEELRGIEARWREARTFQERRLETTVTTLLRSSQLMARSRRFDDAISLRDRARATKASADKNADMDQLNADYEKEFKEALVRHEQVFQEMIEQHEAFKRLLKERQNVADETAEAADRVEAAYSSVTVMDTALRDRINADVAGPVLKHFSPRKKQAAKRPALKKTNTVRRIK